MYGRAEQRIGQGEEAEEREGDPRPAVMPTAAGCNSQTIPAVVSFNSAPA